MPEESVVSPLGKGARAFTALPPSPNLLPPTTVCMICAWENDIQKINTNDKKEVFN
ncbi:MAG: hypothetical protein ABIN36_01795 [Ferruginibacter sp.]